MWQRLISGLFLLMLCLFSIFALGATNKHLTELKSKFPYGLLGDDYGILTIDDLAMNACDAKPQPFIPTSRYRPYQYWKCFDNKNISFTCDSNGIPDKHEGVMALIIVKALANGVRHDYIARRLWPIKECKGFIKDAAALLRGTKYACISGSFIENEKDRSGHLLTSWIFERIKTKNGCEGQGCDFTEKYKRNNCSNFTE